MTIKISETLIKNQILDWLKYKGYFCWLTNTQGNYNKFTNSYYKNPRLLSGVADILGIMSDGKLFAIETKAGKNKLTPDQEQFGINIKANKGLYFVAYDLSDIEHFFESKRLLTPYKPL